MKKVAQKGPVVRRVNYILKWVSFQISESQIPLKYNTFISEHTLLTCLVMTKILVNIRYKTEEFNYFKTLFFSDIFKSICCLCFVMTFQFFYSQYKNSYVYLHMTNCFISKQFHKYKIIYSGNLVSPPQNESDSLHRILMYFSEHKKYFYIR